MSKSFDKVFTEEVDVNEVTMKLGDTSVADKKKDIEKEHCKGDGPARVSWKESPLGSHREGVRVLSQWGDQGRHYPPIDGSQFLTGLSGHRMTGRRMDQSRQFPRDQSEQHGDQSIDFHQESGERRGEKEIESGAVAVVAGTSNLDIGAESSKYLTPSPGSSTGIYGFYPESKPALDVSAIGLPVEKENILVDQVGLGTIITPLRQGLAIGPREYVTRQAAKDYEFVAPPIGTISKGRKKRRVPKVVATKRRVRRDSLKKKSPFLSQKLKGSPYPHDKLKELLDAAREFRKGYYDGAQASATSAARGKKKKAVTEGKKDTDVKPRPSAAVASVYMDSIQQRTAGIAPVHYDDIQRYRLFSSESSLSGTDLSAQDLVELVKPVLAAANVSDSSLSDSCVLSPNFSRKVLNYVGQQVEAGGVGAPAVHFSGAAAGQDSVLWLDYSKDPVFMAEYNAAPSVVLDQGQDPGHEADQDQVADHSSNSTITLSSGGNDSKIEDGDLTVITVSSGEKEKAKDKEEATITISDSD